MKKLSCILALSLLSGACVVHKSEHRKYFEENGYRFLNSQAFTFRILDPQKCAEFTSDFLSNRLQVEQKNILGQMSLLLPETNELFCLVDTVTDSSSGVKSWICSKSPEPPCWEYNN